MTDWQRVEKLRAKGVSWDEIAEDERVGFSPEKGMDPGRALKALHYRRRSQTAALRTEKADGDPRERKGAPGSSPLRDRLPLVGIALLLGGIIWSLIAYIYTPIALVVPLVPDIVLVAVAGAVVLAGALVLWGPGESRSGWKKGVALGLVLGLALTGISVVAIPSGVPVLSHSGTGEPQSWSRYPNPAWESGGLPVAFFYGSEGCPYCSASSWALSYALEAFGTLQGQTYSTSDPNDVYPNTPEVALAGSTLASSSVSWDVEESPSNQNTQPPALLAPIEKDYVAAYSQGIPFVVVGGFFVHTGSLVNPATLQGMTASDVASAYASGSGSVYQTIYSAQVLLEAILVKVDQMTGVSPPSTVAANADVIAALSTLS